MSPKLGYKRKEEFGERRRRRRRTCQTRRRRFLALALRVEVSLILFHRRPPESCFFKISRTLVPQNAPHADAILTLSLCQSIDISLSPFTKIEWATYNLSPLELIQCDHTHSTYKGKNSATSLRVGLK